jgi:protein gp37
MNRTSIEWTTFSANPIKYRRKIDGKSVWACIKTSPGCANCYSEAIALRFNRGKLFNAANMEEVEPFLDEAELHKMRTAKTIGGVSVAGSRCFIGDMTDVFGEWIPDDLLNQLFSGTLKLRTDVTWQILTKRAQRMAEYLCWRYGGGRIPSRNIHVGCSVENQRYADERIPHLLACPAAVRFLSIEPMLGPVTLPSLGFTGPQTVVDWVIVGGESGLGARPCDFEWIRSIVAQCRAANLPCFVKQVGSLPVSSRGCPIECQCSLHYGFKDRKGGDPAEWPADLRVREFPRTREEEPVSNGQDERKLNAR